MPLSFNLQKLPPEALDVLRYLGKTPGPATFDTLGQGTGLSARLIGKAIRRLVNYDYVHVTNAIAYELTSDGNVAVQQIAQFDAENANAGDQKAQAPSGTPRHLTVVLPRALNAGRATDVYFGVNAPDGSGSKLPGTVHVELKISAVNGTVSAGNVSLDIPPDKASAPGKIALTPASGNKIVRVRVDAFQSYEFDSMESLGGMYFDVQIAPEPGKQPTAPGAASRAVGMDLLLKPPR